MSFRPLSLVLGIAVCLASGARADEATDARLAKLEALVAAQAEEISQLREQVGQARIVTQDSPKLTITGGRPTFSSADGRNSVALRAVVQLDAAHHDQDREGPAGSDFRRGSVGGTGNRETLGARDLSDGAYFRRARLGFEGTFERDFGYRFMAEFGGSGTEGPARINDAWFSYTGLAPFTIQAGAFTPSANLDDATSQEELLFPERSTPSEISRTMGGADGRIGVAARAAGQRWMSALAVTTRTVGDAEAFDSQMALVGRGGVLALTGPNYNVHLGASGTWAYQPVSQGTGTTPRHPVRFRDRPELRVDSTRLIDTGSIDAESAHNLGVEFAANYRMLYLQAENFWYGIARRSGVDLDDPKFGAYYVQGSWILTGESRRYNPTTGSFQMPRPFRPFSLGNGWGAWELAGRFSHTDLDFREGDEGLIAALDAVRGGTQDVLTLGLNWYLNPNLRMSFNYYRIDVDRLNPAAPGNLTPFGAAPATPPLGVQIGQKYDVYGVRTQFSF